MKTADEIDAERGISGIPTGKEWAWDRWKSLAKYAESLGYAAQVRDLAPNIDASERSVKIRTSKLARLISPDWRKLEEKARNWQTPASA